MLKKVLEWRKISLPFVALVFHVLKIFSIRNRKLWVFGCWKGMKYDDNSKYLFEYVNGHYTTIRCVWITRNKSVVQKVRELGCEAYVSTSLKGILAALRCGVAIMTNGLDDFGLIPLVGGAKIISLWHGVGGFKKIYNENYHGKKLKLKKIVDCFFNWVYRDYSLATSEYTAERSMEQFGIKRDTIVITGQPRNDLFFSDVQRRDLLSDVDVDAFSKVVLYMPTYRVSPNTHRDTVKDILDELVASQKFNDFLVAHNILFLVKLHPLTSFKLYSTDPHFRVLNDKNVKSVQHLLMAADCLVTDYSSCCVDYALLNRPIVFFVPDEEDYLSYSSLNDAYSRVVKERAKTVDEFIAALEAENMVPTNLLNDLFEDKSISGTCYSENIFRAICHKCYIEP